MSSAATKTSSSKTKSSTTSSSKVVSLPSMTHSLSHLPTMPTVDPRCLHYGGLGASKEASQAKLQQTLQRRDTTSAYGSSTQSHHAPPAPFYPAPSYKGGSANDGDYLMMGKGRKKTT